MLVLKHTPHAHRHFMLLPVCPTASCSILLPWLCVQLLITYILCSSPPLLRIDHEMAPSRLEDGSAPGAGPAYDPFETLLRFRPEPEHSPVDIECLPVTVEKWCPAANCYSSASPTSLLCTGFGTIKTTQTCRKSLAWTSAKDVEVPKRAACTRARHARQIMSNVVPNVAEPEPSCPPNKSPFPYYI